MAVAPKDVVAQMRDALALSEPDLDTTIGTTTRKILDAVGEVVAEAYVDRYVLDYQYDIDSKAGADLDDFVQLFGFTRLPAHRSYGSVTFERTSTSEVETFIPRGTQLSTEGANAVVVATLVPALMMRTDLSIVIPAQAILGGTAGNIGANSLTRALTPTDGIGSFANPAAFTGGTEVESDDQLRTRFKRTIFRNLAGTAQMFTGTALEDPDVSQVSVIGASKTHREQVQMVAGTATVASLVPKYVYPSSIIFGPDLDAGLIYTETVHYTFNTTTMTVTSNAGLVPDGIYDMQFEYVPMASRNDPVAGVTNRVDLYVKGERLIDAQETAIFRAAQVFTTSGTMNVANFQRATTNAPPVAGNYLITLSFGPVTDVSLNNSLVISGVTYTEGVHYFTINDISSDGGTLRSKTGFEFVSAANGNVLAIPADNTPFVANYVYNDVPGAVEQSTRSWRLITTDVRVHTAHLVRLRLSLAVILNPGSTDGTVRPSLEAALATFMDSVDFAGVVQVSDLLAIVHGISGIDAARFLTSADSTTAYAIQSVNSVGTVLTTYATTDTVARAKDVYLADQEVPVFDSVTLVVKAQNTFGTV